MTANRAAAEAIAANLQRYADTIDTYVEALRIATERMSEPDAPAQAASDASAVRQVQIRLNAAGVGTIKVDGHDLSNNVQGVDFRSWPGEVTRVTLHMPQAVEFDGIALVTAVQPADRCPHGATAEELCNKLPSDAELAELRAADGERGVYQSEARSEKARADAAEAVMADWRDLAAQTLAGHAQWQETIKRIAEGAAWVAPKEPLDVEEDEDEELTSDDLRHDPAGCGDPSCDC